MCDLYVDTPGRHFLQIFRRQPAVASIGPVFLTKQAGVIELARGIFALGPALAQQVTIRFRILVPT
jgi:hypothetical protein